MSLTHVRVRRRNEYPADHPARARLQAVLDAIEAKVASLYRVTVSPDPMRDSPSPV